MLSRARQESGSFSEKRTKKTFGPVDLRNSPAKTSQEQKFLGLSQITTSIAVSPSV
jgi:hypothetical protein